MRDTSHLLSPCSSNEIVFILICRSVHKGTIPRRNVFPQLVKLDCCSFTLLFLQNGEVSWPRHLIDLSQIEMPITEVTYYFHSTTGRLHSRGPRRNFHREGDIEIFSSSHQFPSPWGDEIVSLNKWHPKMVLYHLTKPSGCKKHHSPVSINLSNTTQPHKWPSSVLPQRWSLTTPFSTGKHKLGWENSGAEGVVHLCFQIPWLCRVDWWELKSNTSGQPTFLHSHYTLPQFWSNVSRSLSMVV